MVDFLQDQEASKAWFRLYCGLQERSIVQYPRKLRNERSRFVFLAENGLGSLLPDVSTASESERKLALILSAHEGHHGVLQKLLSHGTDPTTVVELTCSIAQRGVDDLVLTILLQYVLQKELIDTTMFKALI